MKNKLRVIDINFASAYLGRFLTVGVTAAVLAITISALTSSGGLQNRSPIVLSVPGGSVAKGAVTNFEPLRELLACERGRAVRMVPRGNGWCEECDLYVLPIDQFLGSGRKNGLVPLYAVEPVDRGRNAAVLISRTGFDTQARPPDPQDVLFTNPRSVNGFWVQLAALESEGFRAPDGVGSLNFASTGTRVVYSVALGQAAIGACPSSDLADAIAAGGIGRHELSVVQSFPAVPELLIACKPDDAGYYRPVLARISEMMAVGGDSGRRRKAVEMMKNAGMRRLRPVSEKELDRAAALIGEMSGRAGGES
ncbi:MAG: PhnD/SsuA/transferrin family substrate-binding protein [Candidatus Latescibacterota bacterium]